MRTGPFPTTLKYTPLVAVLPSFDRAGLALYRKIFYVYIIHLISHRQMPDARGDSRALHRRKRALKHLTQGEISSMGRGRPYDVKARGGVAGICGHCMERILIAKRGRGEVFLTEDGRFRHRCTHQPWQGRGMRRVRLLKGKTRRSVTGPGSVWPAE